MSYKVVVPKGSAPPLAPYSPGAKAGNAVYVSGTLALDSSGKLVGKGDVKVQTRQVLEIHQGGAGGCRRIAQGCDIQSHFPRGHELLRRNE